MKRILTIVIFVGAISMVAYSYFSNEPEVTMTAEETVAVTTSKYDAIFVKTIERRENDGRSLLNVAYPVTENTDINIAVENLSQEFIDYFEETAANQEELYQNYLAETGTKANTAITDYTQHFDVSFANETYVSFVFDRYENTGGTGLSTTFTKIFNRSTGKEIPLRDLFSDDAYLVKLSELSRAILYKRVDEKVKSLDGSEQALAEYVANNRKSIDTGTEPTPENFDSLVLNDNDTLTVYFDKYQVAAGSEGVVTVEIPVQEIAGLLTSEVREIFSIKKPTAPTPPPVRPQSSGKVDCNVNKCVALTFDDGPSIYTATLLNTLQKYNVPATFFVLGRSAKIQPDTISRIVADGHELGNHTWDHKDLRTLSGEEIDAQLQRTDDLIYKNVGVRPLYLRPPYGAYDDNVLTHVDVPIILWSVDPEDWKRPPHEELVQRMTEATNGAIILAHDIHQPTVAAVPEVIAELKKQGFTFVTVGDLLRKPLNAGQVYRHR